MRIDRGSIGSDTVGDQSALSGRSVSFRSKATNHRDLLPGIDGRSGPARRFRDIVSAVGADQGGIEHLSEARLQLVRRFAAACVLAEQLEIQVALGKEVSISEHALLSSTLVRLGQRIGIGRRSRDITPSLQDYLASEYGDDSAEEPADAP